MSLSFVNAVQADIDILFAEFDGIGPNDPSYRTLEEDASELITVALEQVHQQIDVPKLDAFAAKGSEFDIKMVEQAYEILAAVPGTPLFHFSGPGPNPIMWVDELSSMRESLAAFGESQQVHGPLEASLRLSMSLDGEFFRLLLCDVPEETLEELEKLVEESLGPIADDELVKLWAGVLREFAEDRALAPYSRNSVALPEGFLEIESASDLRSRLAQYVVRVKPALARARFAETQGTTIPAEAVGLASILARKVNVKFSGVERRVLSLLVNLYETWGRRHDAEFRRSLGLGEGAWVTRAGQFPPRRREHGQSASIMGWAPVNCRSALKTAKRLLVYADSQSRAATPLADALWMYKLGLEVSFQPKHRNAGLFNETRGLTEIYLQRHACRYLTDRGIPAFGVSFGNAEIDLLARQDPDLIVIEAKIFKTDIDWKKINGHLAQLQRYMDQQRVTPRGVLLIYNRSSVALESSVRWIRDRYWVLAVNLCAETPSRTKRSVLIEEGSEQLLVLTPNFLDGGSAKRAAAKKGRKKKPK